MRILVLGSTGQVGGEVARQAEVRGDEPIWGFHSRSPPGGAAASVRIDKREPEAARDEILQLRPDIVVDCAALHNVDYCETHEEEARLVNAAGTRAVASAARDVGARLLFVSTDFVFGNTGSTPHRESDPPDPLSAYARSKLAGESAALEVEPSSLIVRPSVIYSWTPPSRRGDSSSGKGMNFGTWLVEEVRNGRSVRIVSDQTASPTLASDLAGAILALLGEGRRGIFHAAGRSAVTRFDFSLRLVTRLGLDPNLVRPVRTQELGQKALRPRDSSLSSDRLFQETGYRMLDLEEQLDRFAADFRVPPRAGSAV